MNSDPAEFHDEQQRKIDATSRPDFTYFQASMSGSIAPDQLKFENVNKNALYVSPQLCSASTKTFCKAQAVVYDESSSEP